MLLRALDANRVKILMEDQDILNYDLPFEKLNYDDDYSRAFIYELIQTTYEKTGIDFKNSRIMIEVIPGVSRSYYIILSRLDSEGAGDIEFDKTERPEEACYIYSLHTAKNIFPFFRSLLRYPPIKSYIFFFYDQYYILLYFAIENAKIAHLAAILDEFGSLCQYHLMNDAFLMEHGECLAGPNAYELFT